MQHWLRRLLVLVVLSFLATLPLLTARPTRAQPGARCFAETPYCIQPGPILNYWESNGGLPVFGLPIGELQTETIPAPTQQNPNATWTGPVQWFERDRLEDHTSEGQGVLAGRLGARLLELRGTPWETYEQVNNAPAGCTYFEPTRHSLCEPFLSYWNNNGGLERFGYPITEPIEEELEVSPTQTWTGTVQYFERRRMEHHTENAGTPYEVQLGLLAKEVRSFQPTDACPRTVISELRSAYERVEYFRDDMGCPGSVYTDRPAAIQNFENGSMIWVQLTEDNPRIYAYLEYGYYQSFPDTWQEGVDPEEPDVNPPEGLYKPRRGFGKVWIDNPDLRNDIGWAIERLERPQTATVQVFDNGSLVWLQEPDVVYAFGANEWQAQVLPRQE